MLRKYIQIFKAVVNQYLAYRLNFILWRVRVVLSLILIYFLWWSVVENRIAIFNYSKEQILTYILLFHVISDIVLASRTTDVADNILSGDIINFLLKPFPYFRFLLTKEVADKVLNIGFAVVEAAMFIFIFRPKLFLQTNLAVYPLLLVSLAIGALSYFFISLMLSMIAFWTTQVWAPRFIFLVLISTLAGSVFPIDILPTSIYKLLLLTPFPYFIFLPIKIYLNGLSTELVVPLVMSFFWAVLSFYLARYIWRRGLQEFSFYGR